MNQKPLKGVNLGGWLVAERWMTPSLFGGTDATDEKSLSQTNERARRNIRKHQREFITEADFIWLAEHGVQAVRIPVGYWLFGDEPPFVGSIKRLDFAFEMSQKYGLKILLDIHGAAGSQNGKRHSGSEGQIDWYKNRHKTLDITEKLAERYANSPALWGIELLNEPHVTPRSLPCLLSYYRKAASLIRQHCSEEMRIVISGDGWGDFWAGAARTFRATIDLHYYHSFGGRNRFKPSQVHLEKAARSGARIKLLRRVSPIIIGEWSATLGSNLSTQLTEREKNALRRRYAQLQIKSYEQADAWFYWSYKTEKPGSWNFRSLVEENIIEI